MNLKTAYSRYITQHWGLAMDVETRLQQVATVINQIDDPKCREISVDKRKKLRPVAAQQEQKTRRQDCNESVKLEELYEDPNILQSSNSHSND